MTDEWTGSRAIAALAGGGGLVLVGAIAAAAAPASPGVVLAALAVAATGYLVGVAALRRSPPTLPRSSVAFILGVAVVARAALVVVPPVLEDDANRYLWDGAVVAAGESPYRLSPQEVMDRRLGRAPPSGITADDERRLDRLVRLSQDPRLEPAFLGINYPSVPTIYPPGAQALFAALARIGPGSILLLKLVLVGLDLATLALLGALLGALGQPRRWALVYAWSPLVLVSFAGAAHMDVLPMAALAAALLCGIRGRRALAGAAFGLAVSAKLFPLVAWPALRKTLGVQGSLVALGVIAAVYAPFLGERRLWEGLATFASAWRFNSAGFAVVAHLVPAHVARVVCGLLVLGIALWAARRPGRPAEVVRAVATAVAALVLLSPAVNPWYVAWLVPLVALTRSPSLLALTITILGYYALFLPGVWVVEFVLPIAVAVGFARWRSGLPERTTPTLGRGRFPSRIAQSRAGTPAAMSAGRDDTYSTKGHSS
jgi:hypothetical protein